MDSPAKNRFNVGHWKKDYDLEDQSVQNSIARKSLHEELADILRGMIVDCHLTPGDRINEKKLTEHFGVSRTPLREALKVLSKEGLIQLNVNRGAIVAPVTLSDLQEVFPVLAALEGAAGELACEKISDRDIQSIRKAQARMEQAFHAGDRGTYFRYNQEIHTRILDVADNPTLASHHRSLFGRVQRARFLANLSDERWQTAVQEHKEILSALEERDGAKLSLILRRHLAGKLAALTLALQETA